MGFFDFLKSKKSGFDSMFKGPEAAFAAKFIMLSMELAQLERHAANLKLMGRADEAKRRITEFMVEYVKFGRKRYASQRDISLICYHIAYKLLPELVYKSESTFEHLKSLGVPLPIYLALCGSLEQKTILDPKPLSKFTVSGGQIDPSVDYLLITFPPPPFISRQAMDAAKANLMSGHMDQMGHAIPILAPHFACATFSNEGDKAVYVLGQMKEGGSNLRMVTADGANHNLDLGLGCNIEPEAFLTKIRDHLYLPPLPELSEERDREWRDYLAEKFPESFSEEDDEVESDTIENADSCSETEAASQIEIAKPLIVESRALMKHEEGLGIADTDSLNAFCPRFGITFETPLGIRFCGIEHGDFTMGSPSDEIGRSEDEDQESVRISQSFWIADTPITNRQWSMAAKYWPSAMPDNPSQGKEPDCPVDQLNWQDAAHICDVLTHLGHAQGWLPNSWRCAMPTEAQWEYACRAGTKTSLNNGKDLTVEDGRCPHLDEVAWYSANSSGGKVHPVRLKEPNSWGLFDMHGNVSEWCLDWYGSSLWGGIDPSGPRYGEYHVKRGGSSYLKATFTTCSCRCHPIPSDDCHGVGLRIVVIPKHRTDDAPNIICDPSKGDWLELPFGIRMRRIMLNSFDWQCFQPKRTSYEPPIGLAADKFYIAETQCMQSQWEAIMGNNPSIFKGATLPVHNVSWYDAVFFCERMTFKAQNEGWIPDGWVFTLPTEREWEFACRAGTMTELNNGGDAKPGWHLSQVAWHQTNSYSSPHAVAAKDPNNWGLYDMHGNVSEWCLNWYADTSAAESVFKRSQIAEPDIVQARSKIPFPFGRILHTVERITRGGSFQSSPAECASDYQSYEGANTGYPRNGFRVVLRMLDD